MRTLLKGVFCNPFSLILCSQIAILSRFKVVVFYKSMRKAVFLLIILLFGCSKAVVKPPKVKIAEPSKSQTEEQKIVSDFPEKIKEIDFSGFLKTLDLIILELDKNPEKNFSIKNKNFSAISYSQNLKEIKNLIEKGDIDGFFDFLSKNFELQKVTGEGQKTLFTGYYIPLLEAKREKDGVFKYPIYSKPNDMVSLDLSPLGPAFKNIVFIGRFDDKNNFVPYFSRKEIDNSGVLKEKNLELCYLKDPLDVLLLQIQGSGYLKMEDGEVLLASYAGKNGRAYKSIGKYIAEKNYLPPEEVSWENIRQFLKDNPDKYDEIVYSNPSYVFFTLKKEGDVVGSSKLPLVPFHSIAVDKNFIPLLSLCLINFDKPLVGEDNLVKGFQNFIELAFAMDEGSAIKGADRIDLFCGFGKESEKLAHTLKSEGEVYVLKPKSKEQN